MKVADIEYRDEYIIVDPEESVRSVAAKIIDGFPAVIAAIVTKDGVAQGIIYLDTIVRHCVVGGKDPRTTPAKDIMDRNIISVSDNEDLELVKQKVAQVKPHGIVVTDEAGKIKGFISPRDWAVIIGVK